MASLIKLCASPDYIQSLFKPITMASYGQLTAAFAQASQENILALANFKFDFALIKCEPPEAYRGIGECLSENGKRAQKMVHSVLSHGS